LRESPKATDNLLIMESKSPSPIVLSFAQYLSQSDNPVSNIAYAASMAIKDFCRDSKDATIQGFLKSFDKAILELKEGQEDSQAEMMKGRTNL